CGKEDQPTIETNLLPSPETAYAYVFQCVHAAHYSNCIKYLRSAKSLWPEEFGYEENSETDVALAIYYQSFKQHSSANILVIIQQNPSITDVCHKLYELNLRTFSSFQELDLSTSNTKRDLSTTTTTTATSSNTHFDI
ncbi:unnamed protein product, partial [Didymodactylos carnosus]